MEHGVGDTNYTLTTISGPGWRHEVGLHRHDASLSTLLFLPFYLHDYLASGQSPTRGSSRVGKPAFYARWWMVAANHNFKSASRVNATDPSRFTSFFALYEELRELWKLGETAGMR